MTDIATNRKYLNTLRDRLEKDLEPPPYEAAARHLCGRISFYLSRHFVNPMEEADHQRSLLVDLEKWNAAHAPTTITKGKTS